MAPTDAPSGDDMRGTAGPVGLIADDGHARLARRTGRLDSLESDAAGAGDACESRDRFTRVTGNARHFGERSLRAFLDDPHVGIEALDERQRLDHQAAIVADHGEHDAEQEAEAEAREQKAAKIMPDVAIGEVH